MQHYWVFQVLIFGKLPLQEVYIEIEVIKKGHDDYKSKCASNKGNYGNTFSYPLSLLGTKCISLIFNLNAWFQNKKVINLEV